MEDTKKAVEEFTKIIREDYCSHNPAFKEELLQALKRKTGNDNIGMLCTYIIDCTLSQKIKKSQ